MKDETISELDARRRLEYFEKLVTDAHATLTERQSLLAIERETYAKARPLTEAERAELVEHVRTGGALCCEKGLAWLSERLPKPWANAINGWAYGALGCCFDSPEKPDDRWRNEYADRTRRLKLDKLPSYDE